MTEKIPPVDVNGEVTPITREPVPVIDPTMWTKCHIDQCFKDLSALQNRYFAMQQMNKSDLCQQLKQGIDHLESIIKMRLDKKGKNTI